MLQGAGTRHSLTLHSIVQLHSLVKLLLHRLALCLSTQQLLLLVSQLLLKALQSMAHMRGMSLGQIHSSPSSGYTAWSCADILPSMSDLTALRNAVVVV
jgi:hypothetical protein